MPSISMIYLNYKLFLQFLQQFESGMLLFLLILQEVMSMNQQTVTAKTPVCSSISTIKIPQRYQKLPVNWHKAASSAIEIELIDYRHLLEFKTEHVLGSNSYRIDLLIIKKLTNQIIPKNLAKIFRTFNLLEIKGAGSSLSTDAYYKTIGYGGLFISQTGSLNQFTANDITLTFLCMRHPRKLLHHLTVERHLTVAKPSPGIYTVNKETFFSQIIIMNELNPEENMYLRGLTGKLSDISIQNQIAANCISHNTQPVYKQYLDQFIKTTPNAKGENDMVYETALRLFGTSSEEIAQQVRAQDQVVIDQLSSQNEYLMNLLKAHNIPFDADSNP